MRFPSWEAHASRLLGNGIPTCQQRLVEATLALAPQKASRRHVVAGFGSWSGGAKLGGSTIHAKFAAPPIMGTATLDLRSCLVWIVNREPQKKLDAWGESVPGVDVLQNDGDIRSAEARGKGQCV